MIDSSFTSKLKQDVSAGDTTLPVSAADAAAINETVSAPAHVFFVLYSPLHEEVVMAYADRDGGTAFVRGSDQTGPRAWPAGTCIRVKQIINEPVCDPEGAADGCAPAPAWHETLTVGKGLEKTVDSAGQVTLAVKATGAVPSNMGGAEINDCGQFTFVPPNWPATAMPVFPSCCEDGDGTGGSSDACALTYTPQTLAPIATSTSLCTALYQLEDAIDALDGAVSGGGGVSGLVAGKGVEVSGLSTAPTIGIRPGTLGAGVYGGFTIDECGMVVGYSETESVGATIIGVNPVRVVNPGGTQTFTISVNEATEAEYGTVILADLAEYLSDDYNDIPGEAVITWDFLQQYKSVSFATDAEAAAGTAEDVAINPKQLKECLADVGVPPAPGEVGSVVHGVVLSQGGASNSYNTQGYAMGEVVDLQPASPTNGLHLNPAAIVSKDGAYTSNKEAFNSAGITTGRWRAHGSQSGAQAFDNNDSWSINATVWVRVS